MDFILNGSAQGNVASVLLNNNFEPGVLRPWKGKDGRSYVTVNRGGKPATVVSNAPATLRKDEWILLDKTVVRAAKARLKAVADLRAAGLVFSVANGMAKTVLQTETQSDITGAIASMDGVRKSDGDRVQYNLVNLPLPIVHKDFSFSARQIAASRAGNTPLDTTMAELAGRKVAERIEQQLLGGTAYDFAYASGTIKGYRTFANRNTKSLTLPTATGWTPATTVQEVLQMRLQSQQDYHFGPWQLYCSPNWDVYMDDDYSSNKGDNTLRERLSKIDGIRGVRTLDYLSGYELLLVQFTADVVRMINAMEITTVQWETNGGMQQHFKVMAIQVPQIRADYNGNCGIVHGS